jgi:putative membrane protein
MSSHHRFPENRTWKDYLGLGARGFCMGCADVVPGVSGGTMAFILGIYEELVESIRLIGSKEVIQALFRFDVAKILSTVRWKFLLSVLAGIFIAIASLAKILEHLLETHPVLVWSFFFGLVVASIYSVGKHKKRWTAVSMSALVAGAVGAYYLVGMVPVQTTDAAWFVFLSGAIAICAMILPGISGSFILVLLGKYQYILGAVNDRDFATLLIFMMGCGIGILAFSHVLSWLLRNYHDLTVAVLIGLMAGSLRKIWPWKEVLETIPDRHGNPIPIAEANYIPQSLEGEVVAALVLAAIGFALVLVLDIVAAKNPKRPGPDPAPTV